MLRTLRNIAVAVVAILGLAVPSFAAQAKPAAKATKTAAAKTTAAKTMTLSGTLDKVDGQNLTVKTAKGSEDVMLATDAKIRRAGKTLATSDLNSATGSRVTVRYKEDSGHKMAESVTLAAAKAAAAPKAKTKASVSAKPAAAITGTKK